MDGSAAQAIPNELTQPGRMGSNKQLVGRVMKSERNELVLPALWNKQEEPDIFGSLARTGHCWPIGFARWGVSVVVESYSSSAESRGSEMVAVTL